MRVARLDDLPFILGNLAGGSDIINDDYDPFDHLYNMPEDKLREAIIKEYVIPTMSAASEEVRENIKITLSHLIKERFSENMIEEKLESSLPPVEIPKPYSKFLLEAFKAIYPDEDPYKQPPAEKIII